MARKQSREGQQVARLTKQQHRVLEAARQGPVAARSRCDRAPAHLPRFPMQSLRTLLLRDLVATDDLGGFVLTPEGRRLVYAQRRYMGGEPRQPTTDQADGKLSVDALVRQWACQCSS